MVMSLLTGREAPHREGARVRQSLPDANGFDAMAREIGRLSVELQAARTELESAKAALGSAGQQVETLEAQVQSARTELETARSHAQVQSTRADEMRARMTAEMGPMHEAHERMKAEMLVLQTDLAAERATTAALHAEIGRQAQIGAAVNKLEQAIARTKPQAIEPPVYEMRVVARDVNSRADRIRLTPVKEK